METKKLKEIVNMTTKVSTTWLQCWTTNKQKIACDLSLCVQDIQYIQWE